MELIQYLRDNSENINQQDIRNIISVLEDHNENNFDVICELIKVLPLSEELILPIQNALKHYASISNYYIQQLSQGDVVVSLFTFSLQLGLQTGVTQKLRQQRQRAQSLILNILSADTSVQFAQGLFAAFSLSQQLSATQLSNFLNSEAFPSFLVPQIFNHLINTQIQFAGHLLSQLQLDNLDYKQFINNAESTQLRLIGIQHVMDQAILTRCYDGYYQIRAAFCQQLPKCKDIPNGQKIKILFEKTLDKNVYVRRAAFQATQQVLLSNKLHVMDMQIIYLLQQKVNQMTNDQNNQNITKNQQNDEEDSEDQTNLSEIKWEDYFEQCTYLNQILEHANKRFLQMPQSEFTAFLGLVSECLRLKNDIAQNRFKDIIFQLPNTRINESQKQCLLNFLTEFLLSHDSEHIELEEEQDTDDIVVQNTVKQEVSQIIVQRLLDLYKTIMYKSIFNQIIKMLVLKVPRLQKYLFSNHLINYLVQLITSGSQEDIAVHVLESLVIIMGVKQIQIQNVGDLIVHLVKKLETQNFTPQTNSLGDVIYIILLKQLYDLSNNNIRQNTDSYKQFIFNNIEPILLNYTISMTGVFKIILLQQKIYIDQLMGKLSRLNSSLLQQIYYCVYCGEVIQHLQLNLDIQNSQDQAQNGPNEGRSLNHIYTTLQQQQEDATSFLQEFSYLMYTIPILMRFMESPQIQNNSSVACMLVHTLTQFAMVLPKDLYLQNREFNDVAIELYTNIITVIKDNLINNKIQYINTAITIILNVQSLVFYKPSEYHELMEMCTKSFINIDDQIDSALTMAISQLYNARCIKIQSYIKLLFSITERSDLAQVFFYELDQKIVKQFYRELQNIPGGNIKLLEMRMEEQQNQGRDKQIQEEQMAMMGGEY